MAENLHLNSEILAHLHMKYQWIGNTFQHYLGDVPPNSTIGSLNMGIREGEPLHLAYLYQGVASIHGFDIAKQPQEHKELMRITGIRYHRMNINKPSNVFRQMGGAPTVLISRNPRILEAIDTNSGTITFNNWWAPVLSKYAQRMRGNGKMVITTMTQDEMDMLQTQFNNDGVHTRIERNEHAPPVSAMTYPTPDGGERIAMMDQWVTKIE